MPSHGWVPTLRCGFGLLTGRLETMDGVKVFQGGDVVVDGPDGNPLQMDGDLISALTLSAAVDYRDIFFLVPTPRA
ncbi:MAG: hypothetical protein VW268_13785 [Rhodospirillaceae bacterium]